MSVLSVKHDNNRFIVNDANNVYAEIIFDENNTEANISIPGNLLRVERGEDKNMVLKKDGKALFTFKFDYLWGGAELVSGGVDTGYDIKGRWFKPGTRLTDEDDNDIVVAVKKGNGMEVTIVDESVSPVMVMATIYYHLYASGNKMRAVLMGAATH